MQPFTALELRGATLKTVTEAYPAFNLLRKDRDAHANMLSLMAYYAHVTRGETTLELVQELRVGLVGFVDEATALGAKRLAKSITDRVRLLDAVLLRLGK